jgi:hypothetical protein
LLGLGAVGVGSLLWPGWGSGIVAGQEGGEKPKPKEKFPGRIFVSAMGRAAAQATLAVDPNELTWVKLPEGVTAGSRISPDGRSALGLQRGVEGLSLWITDLEGEKPPLRVAELKGRGLATAFFWYADGKHVLVSQPSKPEDLDKFVTWKVAADGSGQVKLPLPETEWVQGVSPDGHWLVTKSARAPWDGAGRLDFVSRPTYLFRPDGTGERLLIEAPQERSKTTDANLFQFSPDSRTIAFDFQKLEMVNGRPMTASIDLCLIGLDGKDRRTVRKGTPELYPLNACWSPGGKWLAITIWEKPAGAGPDPAPLSRGTASVEIIDVDGRTKQAVFLPPAPIYSLLDWR